MSEPDQGDTSRDGAAPPEPPRGPGQLELGAIACLIGAEALVGLLPIGFPLWLAGNLMLVLSSWWTLADKIRAWLFLAGGYPLIVISTLGASRCAESSACGRGSWVVIVGVTLLVAYFVAQVVTVTRLVRAR